MPNIGNKGSQDASTDDGLCAKICWGDEVHSDQVEVTLCQNGDANMCEDSITKVQVNKS